VFIASVIQHAKFMRRIILSSVACLALQYFSTLSHERHDFRGGGIFEHKMNAFIFPTTFSCIAFHSKKNRVRYYHNYVFVSSTGYCCQILMKLEFFSTKFPKILNYINENLSSGSRVVPLGWTDGRTDKHEKANSHFSQFCGRA